MTSRLQDRPCVWYLVASSLLTFISYRFGYFESHVDIITSSITREIWFDQGTWLLWNGTEFLLPVLYGIINDWIPGVNAFSFGLSLVNSFALILLTHSLVVFSSQIKTNKRVLLVALLAALIIIPHVLTINSTRIAVLGTYGVLMTIVWLNLEQRRWNSPAWLGLIAFVFVLSLIRMEAVALIGAVVGIPLFVFRNRSVKFLIPVTFGLTILITYNLALSTWGSQEMQAFYYYENEVIDRDNTCIEDAYSRGLIGSEKAILDSRDTASLGMTALLYHTLFDEYNANPQFMSSITCTNAKSTVYSWLVGGVDVDGWFSSLLYSIEESKRGWWVIVLSVCSFLLILFARGLKSETINAGLVLLVPLVLTWHITVPARFLVPFLTTYSALCVLGAVLVRPRVINVVLPFGLAIVVAALAAERNWIEERKRNQDRAEQNITELRKLREKEKKFVVMQTGSAHEFMPIKLSGIISRIDSVLFMDEYFVYTPFFKDWKKHCRCEPRSVAERLDFAHKEGAIYISSDRCVQFTSNYTSLIHGENYAFASDGIFGEHYKRYKIGLAEL